MKRPAAGLANVTVVYDDGESHVMVKLIEITKERAQRIVSVATATGLEEAAKHEAEKGAL